MSHANIMYLLKVKKFFGGIAQLVERLPCTQKVSGSNPLASTKILKGLLLRVVPFLLSMDPKIARRIP